MPIDKDSIDLLSDFGLTKYMAKLYLTSVKIGLVTVSELSKKSRVRREEVYRTLPKLEKIGLIERVLSRPAKVRAIPFEDGISILMKRKQNEARKKIVQLSVKKEELLERIVDDSESTEKSDDDAEFILVTEKAAASKRMEKLIEESAIVIEVVDSIHSIVRFLLAYEEAILKSLKNEVHVRILTETPQIEDTIPRMLANFVPKENLSIRYVDDIPGRYILFDRVKVMLATSAKDGFTDSSFLLSQDANLVSLIRRDFEEQFRRSIDWKSYHSKDKGTLGISLKHIRPRDHIVLFYDTIELKHEVLFSYIQDAIQQGEAAIYVCSEEKPKQIEAAMKSFGIDVQENKASGALQILYYTDMYIVDGEFSIDEVMEKWEHHNTEARALGFKGLRVTGEMNCFFKHNLTSELMEYEKALHTILDIPITAICAYSTDTLEKIEKPIGIYSELVKAHGKVLFATSDQPIGRIEVRI